MSARFPPMSCPVPIDRTWCTNTPILLNLFPYRVFSPVEWCLTWARQAKKCDPPVVLPMAGFAGPALETDLPPYSS